MSTDHFLYCQTCNKSTAPVGGYDLSHQEVLDLIEALPILEKMFTLYEELGKLRADVQVDFEITYNKIDLDTFRFYREHKDHKLGVIDEYEAVQKEAYPWE